MTNCVTSPQAVIAEHVGFPELGNFAELVKLMGKKPQTPGKVRTPGKERIKEDSCPPANPYS